MDSVEIRIEMRGCHIYFIFENGTEWYVGTREEAVRKYLKEFSD